jgi:hypothetical protein
MADLEDALKKLDRLTQEEARMAHAEVLRITHSIREEVKIVDGKVERVEDKVEDVGDKVDEVGDKVGGKVDEVGNKVGEKVQCVDEKVQVVIDGARDLSSQLKYILTSILSAGRQAKLIIQQTANGIDEIKCSCLPTNLAVPYCSRLKLLTGNQWKQLLRTWLSPADPSTNHNIARKAQHMGTAAWLFQGQIVIEWKSAGSLLWIHGKRVLLLLFLASDF